MRFVESDGLDVRGEGMASDWSVIYKTQMPASVAESRLPRREKYYGLCCRVSVHYVEPEKKSQQSIVHKDAGLYALS